MKIFISWSGEKSLAFAQLLEVWIKCVLQATQPWISTNIEKGTTWFSEITEQLEKITFGIICLTKQNKEAPWIMFESGALAKGLNSSRLFTFLIDLQNEDVRQPLAQFNHTTIEKEDVKRLIKSINNHLDTNALPVQILEIVFEKYWPEFEQKAIEINQRFLLDEPTVKKELNTDDILREVLKTTRSLDKRMRNLETENNKQSFIYEPNPAIFLNDDQMKNKIVSLIHQGATLNQIREIIINNNPVYSVDHITKLVDRVIMEFGDRT